MAWLIVMVLLLALAGLPIKGLFVSWRSVCVYEANWVTANRSQIPVPGQQQHIVGLLIIAQNVAAALNPRQSEGAAIDLHTVMFTLDHVKQ